MKFKARSSQVGKIMGARGLGKTGETYVKSWMLEQIYNRKIEFSSKYTDKGNLNEDTAIDMAADYLDYGMLVKNEEHFNNDFLTGTPDIITNDEVIDIKCSWSFATFPILETDIPTKDYYWQLQSYMALTGKQKAKLVYVLTDTPDDLIQKEAYYKAKDMGYDQDEMYNKLSAEMCYKDIDNVFKIKIFEVERNDADIKKIYERVTICQDLVTELVTKLK